MKPIQINQHATEPAVSREMRDGSLKLAMRYGLVLGILWLAGAASHTARAQYARGLVLPEGYVQVEGDIITTEAKAAELLGSQGGIHPLFSFAPGRLWPNRVVPYDFDAGVSTAQRSVFLAAMAMWTNSFPGIATITFQPRNSEAGYLHLVVADPGFVGGNTDYVGYNGGEVTITVHPSAVAAGLISHEMGHALGLWHEQSRDDRDSFISIITANIQPGYSSQFDKKSPEATFGTYDYGSIMHYFSTAFSKCSAGSCADPSCVTMQVVSQYSAQECLIGQQIQPSGMDRRGMAFRYAPADWRFLYPKAGSSAIGSVDQPFLSVSQASAGTPANGTLWLGPGTYAAAGLTISTPMTLKAALADLQLQSNGSLGPSPSGYATLR
jgi:hypothetical protein